jgi:hypothetical protein
MPPPTLCGIGASPMNGTPATPAPPPRAAHPSPSATSCPGLAAGVVPSTSTREVASA